MAPTLDELTVADWPEAWRACGFQVDGDMCVGDTRIRMVTDHQAFTGVSRPRNGARKAARTRAARVAAAR